MDKLKERFQKADWWEITYLIIFGAVFTYEFLNTTMFEIIWPPRFGYIFLASTALYVIAKFIWHNTYTKKEMIWAGVILFAFLMPALLTDYRFLWYVGFLIVGAKDIDFNKLLKVYLVIGITIMVVAFGASQYGLIEDLIYTTQRYGKEFFRHSYGIVYPTDYAAHLFYIVMAVMVLFEKKMTVAMRAWISLLVAGCVMMTSNAQTSMISLVVFAILCVVECLLGKHMPWAEKISRWAPVGCATVFMLLTCLYDESNALLLKLNGYLSGRLAISNKGLDMYSLKLFGQNIIEEGNGRSTEVREDYFFLDDSYIRILLEYGIILCIVVLVILMFASKKAMEQNRRMIVIALVAIAVHSIMEHHLIDLSYNPFIYVLFASLADSSTESKKMEA